MQLSPLWGHWAWPLHTVAVMVIDGKHGSRTWSPILPCNNRVYQITLCQASIPSIIIGNGKFQSAATAHPSLSTQVRGSHCNLPFAKQSEKRRILFSPSLRCSGKLKNYRKTSASLQKIPGELSDTLQKYRCLSLLFWHVPRGLRTGSSVVILYALFSSFHLSQLIPAPAHLHLTVSSINFWVTQQDRKAPLRWKVQKQQHMENPVNKSAQLSHKLNTHSRRGIKRYIKRRKLV